MDVAKLSRALISQFPESYRLYREKSFTYNGISQKNRNDLLWIDDSVDGIKTGYTRAAGYCLAASAKRDGMRLISVVMGAPSAQARVSETRKLLSYGFRFFQTADTLKAGEQVHQVRLWGGMERELPLQVSSNLQVTIPRGREQDLQREIVMDEDFLRAPVAAGERYGELLIRLDGRQIAATPMYASIDVAEAGWLRRTVDGLRILLLQPMEGDAG